jgi:hypothetical protein
MEEDEDGQLLPSCVLAGPMGDDARRLMKAGAKLHGTFEAGSYFEAMTIYNRMFDRGGYETDHDGDRQPYPEGWLRTQISGGDRLN